MRIGKCCLCSPLAPLTVHFFMLVHGARTTAQTTIAAVHRACLQLPTAAPQPCCPAAQQQWAHLARVDDRTAVIKVDSSEISIDYLTTPRPHHHHLSPCCFFCILLCVIQHCHCSSCAQHNEPTAAAGRVICACGRSALYAQY